MCFYTIAAIYFPCTKYIFIIYSLHNRLSGHITTCTRAKQKLLLAFTSIIATTKLKTEQYTTTNVLNVIVIQ